MRLWVGLVLICGVAPMPDSKQLYGEKQACPNEGEIVDTKNIKDTKCFTCVCKNGFVECEKDQCPTEKGCYRLMELTKDSCCRKCKGCLYNGLMWESGTEWRDPSNPCKVLTCKAGVITQSEEQCHVQCSNPLKPETGQCCPTCPGCRLNGKIVSAGRIMRVVEDPCLGCQCLDGRLLCSKKACPVLHCPRSAIITKPGDCCPTCSGSRNLIEPPSGKCMIGSDIHGAGTNFTLDRCTSCSCNNGTAVCGRTSCPVLECPPEWQITPAGYCCPVCPPNIRSPTQEVKTACTFAGRTYKEGESWQIDQCKSCLCKDGRNRCVMEMCPQSNIPCPPNHRLTTLPGQCCPKCVENDRVCTVFGDPHYRTFDGKFYSFQGPCKYQLTADCVDGTFSIRVTNNARSTKTSSWTKTVSIKVRDMKVNLGARRRVKVDGVRVSIPHMRPGLRVTESEYLVQVETDIGLRVLWDGSSFLEVSVPPKYKGRLCGLCGNFNSLLKDDFTTRQGRLVADPIKFGTSWRVGGRRACTRHDDLPQLPARCSSLQHHKRFREKKCKPLKTDIFSPCHKKLNYMVYHNACLVDMCECPWKKCYCDVFTAYAHECKRLGVFLPDWRNQTGCVPRH